MWRWVISILAVPLVACGSSGGGSADRAGDRATAVLRRERAGPAIIARLRLPGTPDGVASSPDGRFAFVALQSGTPRIAVVGVTQPGLRLLRTIAVPAYPSGMRVTPDGRYVLAAAGRGAIVLSAAAAESGTGRSVVGTLTAPRAVAGGGPGAAEVATSKDGRFAFVTLEGAGTVAVFRLVGLSFIGAVPVGAGALGIAPSPDGRRLYVVSEGTGRLSVIDVRRAARGGAGRGALVARAPVAGAPVRVALSPDGATAWVTAKSAGELLGIATATLRATSRVAVAAAPLGVAELAGDRVLVAAVTGGSLDVVSTTGRPALLATLRTGRGTDAIAPAPGGTALVTVSGEDELVAVR